MSERDNRYGRRNSNSGPRNSRGPRNSNSRGRKRSNSSKGRSYFYLSKGTRVVILDILQHGGVDNPNHSWNPICQAIKLPTFQLYEILINKGEIITLQDKILITGQNDSLGKVQRTLKFDQLTPTSSDIITEVIKDYVAANEVKYIEFINRAGPITIKRHSLEILPGVGKKLMWEVVNEREKEKFTTYGDLHKRVPGFKIVDAISKRIVEELENKDLKHYLFVKKRRPSPQNRSSNQNQRRPGSNPRRSGQTPYKRR